MGKALKKNGYKLEAGKDFLLHRISTVGIFAFMTIIMNLSYTYAEDKEDKMPIPANIVYKAASDSINKKTEETLREIILQTPHNFNKVIPDSSQTSVRLGVFFSNDLISTNLHKEDLRTLDIIATKVQVLDGAVDRLAFGATTGGQKAKLAEILAATVIFSSAAKIRKLTPVEIVLVWNFISWDIDEPIFVVEDKEHKYIFDFDPTGTNMTWVEDIMHPCLELVVSGRPETADMCAAPEFDGSNYQIKFQGLIQRKLP